MGGLYCNLGTIRTMTLLKRKKKELQFGKSIAVVFGIGEGRPQCHYPMTADAKMRGNIITGGAMLHNHLFPGKEKKGKIVTLFLSFSHNQGSNFVSWQRDTGAGGKVWQQEGQF